MNLLGKGNDKAFWSETVRNSDVYKFYRDDLFKNWNNLCENDTMPDLKYTEYRLYGLTGDRGIFQKPYYRRRVQLETATILALIYPEEEKYINYAMDMIFIICNEYSWCIPAHQPELLTKVNKTHLDLFACETAYTLSEVYTLLGDRLDTLIRELIKHEVKIRLVDSYIEHAPFGWERSPHNWAAVCAGSVGCTFMLLFPELFESVKDRIAATMECYLSGFNDDGFCLEGTHYWHYGFGFFCAYAEMLRRFTDGKDNYFEREKIRTIATFIQKVYLSGTKSISFSDGGESCVYQIGLLHFLKKEYPDDVVVYSPEYSYIYDGCGRFNWLVRAATWLDEDIYNNPAPDNCAAEYYGKDSRWMIKKTANYGFAGKSGHNSEPHNHNDVGSFIIAKNNRQIFCDLGSGVYSQQYFGANTRYSFIECSSLGHSVPYFGDIIQKTGASYSATDTNYENGIFSFDMAGAYGDERVISIVRSFEFTEDDITLTDKFVYNGDSPITERFVTKIAPVIEGSTVTVDCVTAEFDENICAVEIKESITSKNVPVYFIDFTLKCDCKEFKIVFKTN